MPDADSLGVARKVTPMRTLVAVASKYGSTMEIGQAIAEVLVGHDLEVAVADVADIDSVEGYDAVVLGSGVYAGHWLKEAKAFVDRHEQALGALPVWLFSSGPVGDPPKPEEDPVDAAPVLERTRAAEHRVLGGKIDRSKLGFGDKAIVRALRVPDGDFRDWAEIRRWASDIARALRG
jgi:menaquinone-dependent protoporphyrinogen oxidase